jgi:hypothetical protein
MELRSVAVTLEDIFLEVAGSKQPEGQEAEEAEPMPASESEAEDA